MKSFALSKKIFTSIRSLSIIVLSRCAIVNTVHSLNLLRIALCINSSVLKFNITNTVQGNESFTYALSTLAVASSITRILLFFRIALAKQISCFWPTLKFEPFSLTVESNPLDMTSCTSAFSCNWKSKIHDESMRNLLKVNFFESMSYVLIRIIV